MRVILLGFLLGVSILGFSKDLQTGRASSVDLSAERLDRITALSRQYVEAGKLSGVVTMVSRKGKIVHFEAVGKRGLKDDRPLSKDALFRIYSMSKPITAVAAMILYEEGKFQLLDPVTKFLPELNNLRVLENGELVEPKMPITMQQLLSHTAGFTYGFTRDNPVDKAYQDDEILNAKNLDEFVNKIAEIPLLYQPGTRWNYSIAVDLTGAVVERISGMPFDQFLRQRVFEPLQMNDTFFDIPESKLHRFLPNQIWDAKKQQQVSYIEEGYPIYQNTSFFSGGGGLVSTAMDYMRFAEMLRRGGELDGKRILSPKTLAFMTQNHLPGALVASANGENIDDNLGLMRGRGFGLGFGVVNSPVEMAVLTSEGEYSWGGAAGTIFWVDPVEDMIVVAMIQQMRSPWPLRFQLRVLSNAAIVKMNK